MRIALVVFVVVSVATAFADTEDLAFTPCSPGTVRQQACNTCTCLATGIGYSCTKLACSPERRRRDVVLTSNDLAVTPCTAGSTRVLDCNTCTCAPNGSGYRCTRLTCPTHDRKKRDVVLTTNDLAVTPCTAGSTQQVDCNTCTCVPNGSGYRCTRLTCPTHDRKKRDETTGHVGIGTQPVQGNDGRIAQHCTPGSSYKKDCNTCVCGETGHAVCTQIFCIGRK